MNAKEIGVKELKHEALNMKNLSKVQEAIVKFFQLESWQEALTQYGDSVRPERLLRFKVNLIDMYHFSKIN